MRIYLSLAILAICCLLPSCSAEQVYGVGQAWQRNECFKISDDLERSRCLETANTPYGQYQRKTEELR